MIAANNLRNGTTFLADGVPYKVIKFTFIKMGRGGATVRVKVRNMLTGGVDEKSYSSAVKLDEVSTYKRLLQYLYSDGKQAVFMDPKTYEQVEVASSSIAEELPFVKEGESINLMFWDQGGSSSESTVLSAEIPSKVSLKVAETVPGVKGNSASNVYKDAVLENGLAVKIPLFINVGESVRVDTKTGEYVERG